MWSEVVWSSGPHGRSAADRGKVEHVDQLTMAVPVSRLDRFLGMTQELGERLTQLNLRQISSFENAKWWIHLSILCLLANWHNGRRSQKRVADGLTREIDCPVAAGSAVGCDLRPYRPVSKAAMLSLGLGRENGMHAKTGDRIVIKGHRVGEHDRECEVIEVHGRDDGPPYLVRWGDSGHESLFFPGSDASVEPYKSADRHT